MNVKKLIPLAAVGALAFGTLAPHAQNNAQKLAYVDVTAVQKAHPKWAEIETLTKQGEAALKPTRDKIQAIQQKGTNATAAERQQYETLVKTFQGSAKEWDEKVQKASAPILEDVNKAVAAAAKAQGVSLVLGKEIAASSQLVIYADPALDLTPTVIKQIKK